MKTAVCFHGRARCHHCWSPTTGLPARRPRLRLRCPACGRWGPHRGPCTRCTERGHRPLRLPGVA